MGPAAPRPGATSGGGVEYLFDEEAVCASTLRASRVRGEAARQRPAPPQLSGQLGQRRDDLLAVHASDPVQGALGEEDPATAEGCRRLGDRYGAKTWDIADEPEAIEKPPGVDRP